MKLLKTTLLIISLAFLFCAFDANANSQEGDFDKAKVALIAKGKTTQAEIQKLFGKPATIYEASDYRGSIWSYVYSKFVEIDGDQRDITNALYIYFDEHGVVERFSYSHFR